MKTLPELHQQARFLFPEVDQDKLTDFITEVYCGAYEQCMIDWDVVEPLCKPLEYKPLPTRPILPQEEETDFNCANL